MVRTLEALSGELARLGHQVLVLGPDRFRTIPCPSYAEIRLALGSRRRLGAIVTEFRPDAVHIATEGPLGWQARAWCLARNISFTTAYHTRFPEYLHARFGMPVGWTYALLRRFHGPAAAVMVATPSIEAELARRGFRRMRRWSRGVDLELFRPRPELPSAIDAPRPILLYVGRVAVEKNIEAFLDLDVPGSKIVVGGGPQLAELRLKHPAVRFTGPKKDEDLGRHYAAADVFVFPSRTDTFGLVLLEALASGVPVAAYPVPGPRDIVSSAVGVLDDDLAKAVRGALGLSREACRAHAARYSWRHSAEQFLANLCPLPVAAEA